ncbi:MAG: CHAD domain-containing protein [Pseudomonadota bacterium]
MKEIELKLLLVPGEAAALRRRITTQASQRARTRRLLTIYLDTHEGGLAAAGIALRLRREGRAWTQTVKTARSMRAGLSETLEIDTPAPGGRVDIAAIPDERARAAVKAAVADLPVAPVFETDMSRATWEISHNGARVEIALDKGEVRAGDRSEALEELELELKEGTPEVLFDLARGLFRSGPLRFSRLNKAARGRRLSAGEAAVPPALPRNAEAPSLKRSMTAEEAGREILTECLAQVTANVEATAASDDSEGPHQLRVGLRRLRAALALLRPAFDGPRHRALETEARWLAGEAGRVRDLDVAIEDLVAPAAHAAPCEQGFAPLEAALTRRLEAERLRLRETLSGQRATAFLLDFAEYVALRGWLDPADHTQTMRLATPYRALAEAALIRGDRKAARRAGQGKGRGGIEALDIEARHELRKSLKALRYTLEFALPLWSEKKSRPLVKALKTLQTLFGALNDAALAEHLLLSTDAPGGDDPAAMRAAGRLIGAGNAMAERDWERAQMLWHGFAAVPRPWVKAR